MNKKKAKYESIPSSIIKRINEIKNDTIHGSTILTEQAIEVINDFLSNEEKTTKTTLKHIILELKKAQPTMALLVFLSNELLFFINRKSKESKDQTELNESIQSFLDEFSTSLQQADEEIQKHAINHLDTFNAIATYSSSGTIKHTLISLAQQNKNLQIYCSESRPKNEGRQLAKDLAKKNINVTYMTDVSLFSRLSIIPAVLIGADAITNDGIINKIGTNPLAHLTTIKQIPLYCLCSTHKILPFGYPLPEEPEKPSTDLLKEKVSNIKTYNYYFDITPLDMVTAVITENGLYTKERIHEQMRRKKVHHLLK